MDGRWGRAFTSSNGSPMLESVNQISSGGKTPSLKVFGLDVFAQSLCLVMISRPIGPRDFEMAVGCERQSVLEDNQMANPY